MNMNIGKKSTTSVKVHRASDVPTDQHWAIIRETSTYIAGDERSRTNPGHGYPASTEYGITYEAFTDEKEWAHVVRTLTTMSAPFKAMKVVPARITTEVNVTVE